MQLALEATASKHPVKAVAAVQPSSKQAEVTGAIAVSAHAALSDVNHRVVNRVYKTRGRNSAVQLSQQEVAAWVEVGKDQAGTLRGFQPAIAGLEPRLSDSSDAAYSPIGSTCSMSSRLAGCGAGVLAQWEDRCSSRPKTSEVAETLQSRWPRLQNAEGGMQQQRPPSSPFEALAVE